MSSSGAGRVHGGVVEVRQRTTGECGADVENILRGCGEVGVGVRLGVIAQGRLSGIHNLTALCVPRVPFVETVAEVQFGQLQHNQGL